MKNTSLHPMPQATFDTYIEDHLQAYARDRMLSDFETLAEATKVTHKQNTQALPQGLQTPDHHFFIIRDTAADQKNKIENSDRGYAWLHIKDNTAFLYHIIIHENYRRQGYASSAVNELKKCAKQKGASQLWLNVFGHNKAAQAFYQSQGFQTAAIHMNTKL